MTTHRRARHVVVAVIAMVLASLATAPGASAQTTNPYERGPAPTRASIEALRGPYSTSTTSVSSLVSGFGGGTIYYPTGTSQTFGAVAVAPGYTASSSSMSWLGPRLASQGFVVFTIDTNSRFDQPGSRGTQLLAALDYLTTSSTSAVRNRIDPDRLAVMGHSMGGGGAIAASNSRPSLRASIPLTPWHTQKNWPRVSVPTLIVGAERDSTASVRSHAIPLYEGMSSSLDKAYLELAGAGHFAPNSSNTTIASYSISWLKRFVDDDVRYDQFLCGPNHTAASAIGDYRSTCPYSPVTPGDPGDPGAPAQCVRTHTRNHVSADRAVAIGTGVWARGSGDYLGTLSWLNYRSLQQIEDGWTEVASCP